MNWTEHLAHQSPVSLTGLQGSRNTGAPTAWSRNC